MKPFDLIAIGDITTDAFIRLKDASVHCDIDDENCTISMRFGDKIPYESVTEVRAVGNSPNAAVAAKRLDLTSALITDIGSDRGGDDILTALLAEGIDTRFVARHQGKETNYHYVLWYGDERTILVLHHEYERKFPELVGAPRWLYLSSLGEDSLPFHHDIAEYLIRNPETKLAFQPGTFQMKLGVKMLKGIYERTEVFFCNKEEAGRILEVAHRDITDLLTGVRALGPKLVVITDGKDGAYVFDGNETWKMPAYPDPKPPLDRTGAGDAFASTFASCLALGMTTQEAIRRAPINSMSVVQYVGAQKGLLSMPEIENYLREAPASYKPERL